ncbi:MAG TPA: hypothetical protein VF092_29210 [Longimicrobium sp.]
MHQALIRTLLAAAMTVVVVPRAAAQGLFSRPGPAALSAVMSFRGAWLADSTRFDGCSVARLLGPPAEYMGVILPPMRRMIDTTGPCGAPAGEPVRRARPTVWLDSLTVADSVAYVSVTVLRGELTHRERYTLTGWRPGLPWAVVDMHLWGASQQHFRPRQEKDGAGAPP